MNYYQNRRLFVLFILYVHLLITQCYNEAKNNRSIERVSNVTNSKTKQNAGLQFIEGHIRKYEEYLAFGINLRSKRNSDWTTDQDRYQAKTLDDSCISNSWNKEYFDEPFTTREELKNLIEALDTDINFIIANKSDPLRYVNYFSGITINEDNEKENEVDNNEDKMASAIATDNQQQQQQQQQQKIEFGNIFFGINSIFADSFKYLEAINRNLNAIQLVKTRSQWGEHRKNEDVKYSNEIRTLMKTVDRNYGKFNYKCIGERITDEGFFSESSTEYDYFAKFRTETSLKEQFRTLIVNLDHITTNLTNIQKDLVTLGNNDKHFSIIFDNIIANDIAFREIPAMFTTTMHVVNETKHLINKTRYDNEIYFEVVQDLVKQSIDKNVLFFTITKDLINKGSYENAANFLLIQNLISDFKAETTAAFSSAEMSHKTILQEILRERVIKSSGVYNSFQLMEQSQSVQRNAVERDNFYLTEHLINGIKNETIRHSIEAKSERYKFFADTKNLMLLMKSEIFSAINQTATKIIEWNQRSEINNILAPLKSFVENIDIKIDLLEEIENAEQLKLQLEDPNGILSHFVQHTNPTIPHYLYSLLEAGIISRNFAIPHSATDQMAYHAIEYLYRGTRLYYKLIQTILNSYAYLAVIYHENDDVIKFNECLETYFFKFKEFRTYFGSATSNYGLIYKVIKTLTEVSELNFIKTDRRDILDGVIKRLKWLNKTRNSLKERTIFSTKKPPTLENKLDFSVSNMTTHPPIGKWKDDSTVRYALQYVYKNGFTKIGDWSSPYTIEGKANPELTLPTDENVIKRLIFRKFNSESAELVGIIKDNSQTKFRDINKDLYNVAFESNERKSLNFARIFISNGADVNFKFKKGKSILHVAAEQDRVQFGQLLLNQGANINAKDDKGQTPLYLAAEKGHERFIEFAVENKADINVRMKDGLTPLINSAINKRESVSEYLLASNISDINAPFLQNFTVLHIATINHATNLFNKVIENARTELNAQTVGGFTPLHLAVATNNEKACLTLIQKSNVNTVAETEAGITPLHIASIVGNEKITKMLVSRTNVNSKTVGDFTPLHLAAAVGNLPFLKILSYQTNIELNAKTTDSMTPLHLAVALRHEEVALELLKHNKIQRHPKEKHGLMPAHLAISTGQKNVLISLLKDDKTVVNETIEDNLTLLHFAAMSNNSEAVSILLQYGANILSLATGGLTVLHIACIYGSTEVAKLLITNHTELMSKKAYNNLTALHFAASSNSEDIAEILVQNRADINALDDNEQTPLYVAYKYNNSQLAAGLISKGANLNLLLSNQKTLLHLAIENADDYAIKHLLRKELINKKDSFGWSPLHYAAQSRKLNICSFLLDSGADAYAQDDNENMPIHLASLHGKTVCVDNLIKHYSNLINAEGENKFTPLHCAVKMNQAEMIKFLISKGADLNAIDTEGKTALHWAAMLGKNESLKILLQYGANVFATDKFLADTIGYMPFHLAVIKGQTDAVRILSDHNITLVNLKGWDKKSPLHYAVRYNHTEMISILINKGADINVIDNNGITPLHMAAKLENTNILKILLQNGADVFAKNKAGDMPIHLSVQDGNINAVLILLEHNSGLIDAKGKNNRTPLYYASADLPSYYSSKEQRQSISDLLRQRGAILAGE